MFSVKFNNGVDCPVLGVGTYLANTKGEAEQLVKDAIDIGYRHFDTAMIYGNENEVGSAIKAKIAEGVVTREDIFVTTKEGEGDEIAAKDADGKYIITDVDYVDTWKGMEECVKLGLSKSIGISNFNSQQINRILAEATIIPATNQVEVHPYLNQSKLIAFCKEKGITITAYSPIGRPKTEASAKKPAPLQDPKLQELAKKYKKTVAQVILRYLIQHGTIPIPKSSNKQRLQENFEIFDFEISKEDKAAIDALDKNVRIAEFELFKGHKDYPFDIEY